MKKVRILILFTLSMINVVAKTASDASIISQGRITYHTIQTGQIDLKKLQNNTNQYLHDIAALMFYFYNKTVKKNQEFSSGTFVISDPGFKVYNFLYQYVATKRNKKDMLNEVLIDVKGVGAYPRKSTHFNDLYLFTGNAKKGLLGAISKKNQYIHYGIDFPKSLLLPSHKKHILFGKVQESPPLTFIKMEAEGLGVQGVAQHALDLGISQTKKAISKTIEKFKRLGFNQEGYLNNILKPLSSAVSDDKPNARRERIPIDVLSEFLVIVLSPGSPIKKEAIDIKQIKAFGIQHMLKIADTYSNNAQSAWQKTLKAFAQKLRKEYDHTNIRIGREVILTPESELKD